MAMPSHFALPRLGVNMAPSINVIAIRTIVPALRKPASPVADAFIHSRDGRRAERWNDGRSIFRVDDGEMDFLAGVDCEFRNGFGAFKTDFRYWSVVRNSTSFSSQLHAMPILPRRSSGRMPLP